MRCACRMTKIRIHTHTHTHTHTQTHTYTSVSPWQQWLRESASILRLPLFFINSLEPISSHYVLCFFPSDALTLQIVENSLEGPHALTKGRQR